MSKAQNTTTTNHHQIEAVTLLSPRAQAVAAGHPSVATGFPVEAEVRTDEPTAKGVSWFGRIRRLFTFQGGWADSPAAGTDHLVMQGQFFRN